MRQLNPAQPLTMAAYESLRESICTGALASGERLIQSELAERLGVSRLPVHEALQRLRQEGFVTETGRRGLVVSALEPDFMLQLFELRASLDRTAGRAAARARRPADAARGLAIVERGRKGIASRSLAAVANADHAFHGLIYQIGGNPLIAASAERNWHHVRRAFLSLVEIRPELAVFWEDHATILQAVMDGEEDRAGELCWDHSIRSGLAYSAELRRRAEARTDPVPPVLRRSIGGHGP
ncbi:MAG: GntR family transcriptional regulator [Janthinobacterium lividum]